MKPTGFTLIELIIVIVLLGILATTAAPKFIGITTDARIAKLHDIKAQMKSAVELVYYEAEIKGVAREADSYDVVVLGMAVDMEYGYPEATAEDGDKADVLDLLSFSDDMEVDGSNNDYARIGFNTKENGCYVQYNEPDSPDAPSQYEYSIVLVTDGC